MVRRHLTLPHSLAVVTDIQGDFGPGVEVIPPPGDFEGVSVSRWGSGRPNCFRRLAIFRPDAAQVFGDERIVSMDLDVVISDSLDPLFASKDDLRICAGTS